MRWLVRLIIAPVLLTGSFAAQAQDALDRVDPTRLEQRKVEDVAQKQSADDETVANSAVPASAGTRFVVGAIEITGLTVLRNSDFADIVQQYIGRSLDSSEMGALVERLAARARIRFPLASARVAPQEIAADILRVELDEGRVDGVELEGFANRRVEGILGTLANGRPVTAAEFERALLLARDIDGITVRDTTIRRVGNRNILVVKGTYARLRGQVAVDNDTTRPIGPFEVFGFVQSNGVLAQDDSLQAYFLAALPEPEELAFLRLRYAKRIDYAGTELSVAGSYSRSIPGSYLAPFEIEGDSAWVGVALSRPLARSITNSLWLEANLSFRELRQDSAGLASRLDRLTVARLRLTGSARVAGGTLRSAATLSHGLDVLNATRSGDLLASRQDADGVFSSLQLEGKWTGTITGPLKLAVEVKTQIATKPLLVSEEIGLGGARFARGYDYSERTGDQGSEAYLELAYDLDRRIGPFAGVTPYLFVDGGEITNLANGRGGGALFSTGGGLRFDVDRRTDASVEIAVPLSGPRYDTDTQGLRTRASVTRYF